MSEFLSMGGYGAYVWSAFGFTALLMIVLLVQSWLGARRKEREFEELKRTMRPQRKRERRPLRPTRMATSGGPEQGEGQS